MSKPKPSSDGMRRFVACTQSTGRVGKSTFAEGLLNALNFAGVPCAVIDADPQHQTLSRRYPDQVNFFDATRSPDDFSKMIRAMPDAADVILVDFPAGHTDTVLQAFQALQLLKYLENVNVRVTLLIFAADDPTAVESATNTVSFFGGDVDYLLVKNPQRFDSQRFPQAWFNARKVPMFHIPQMTPGTVGQWENAERKVGKFLGLSEAKEHPELHPLCRGELEYFYNRFLCQVEDRSGILMPDPSKIQGKTVRVEAKKYERMSNPLTSTLLETA